MKYLLLWCNSNDVIHPHKRCFVCAVLCYGYRDAEGRPSCIRDECAHRACPLSLGEVVDGKVGQQGGSAVGMLIQLTGRQARLLLLSHQLVWSVAGLCES